MRKLLMLACFGFASIVTDAQQTAFEQINNIITHDIALAPLKYLASDELKGRSARREEINVAAKYIADHFRNLNMNAFDSAKNYFQVFEIKPKDTSIRVL